MTNLRTSEDHRLVQVFLSANGVFEVYIHVSLRTFACTCPGFRARSVCKHATHVANIFQVNEGCYPAVLRKGADSSAPLELADSIRFRDWVINNARVEVL